MTNISVRVIMQISVYSIVRMTDTSAGRRRREKDREDITTYGLGEICINKAQMLFKIVTQVIRFQL